MAVIGEGGGEGVGVEGGSNGTLDRDWQQKGARRKSLLVTSTGVEAYIGEHLESISGGGVTISTVCHVSRVGGGGYRRRCGPHPLEDETTPIKR